MRTQLPEKWCIKNDRREVGEWFDSRTGEGNEYYISHCTDGYLANKNNKNQDLTKEINCYRSVYYEHVPYDFEEITFDEFQKFVLNKNSKSNKMITVTREQLGHIYNVLKEPYPDEAVRLYQITKDKIGIFGDKCDFKTSVLKHLHELNNTSVSSLIEEMFPEAEWLTPKVSKYEDILVLASKNKSLYTIDDSSTGELYDRLFSYDNEQYIENDSNLCLINKKDIYYINTYMKLFNIAKFFNKDWEKTVSNTGWRFYKSDSRDAIIVSYQDSCLIPGVIYFKEKEHCEQALKMLSKEDLDLLFLKR